MSMITCEYDFHIATELGHLQSRMHDCWLSWLLIFMLKAERRAAQTGS